MSWRCLLQACAAAVLAICEGCVHKNVIELAPGSTPDSLFFVVSGRDAGDTPGPLPGFAVVRCMDDQPMWIIVDQSGGTTAGPTHVQASPDFVVSARPEPLLPDCYKAIAPGAASLRFFVDLDGRVISDRVQRVPDVF